MRWRPPVTRRGMGLLRQIELPARPRTEPTTPFAPQALRRPPPPPVMNDQQVFDAAVHAALARPAPPAEPNDARPGQSGERQHESQ